MTAGEGITMGKRTYRLTAGDIIKLDRRPTDPWTHAEVDGYYVRRENVYLGEEFVKAIVPVFGDVYYPPDDCDNPVHRDDSENWFCEQVGTKFVWRPRASVQLLNLVEAVGSEVWEVEDLLGGGRTAVRIS